MNHLAPNPNQDLGIPPESKQRLRPGHSFWHWGQSQSGESDTPDPQPRAACPATAQSLACRPRDKAVIDERLEAVMMLLIFCMHPAAISGCDGLVGVQPPNHGMWHVIHTTSESTPENCCIKLAALTQGNN